MSKDNNLGEAEAIIEDQAVSGCMTYAMPVVFLVAGYFAKASWAAIRGTEHPIIEDSRGLNLIVGLFILGASLFFCVCAVIVLIGGLWKTKIKFYARGFTLHGMGATEAIDKSRFLYSDVEHVRISEKHNLREQPAPRGRNLDLLDMAVNALSAAKPVKRPGIYESTEYTFNFKLKGAGKFVACSLMLDRAGGEIPAIIERLEAEGIRVERDAQEVK